MKVIKANTLSNAYYKLVKQLLKRKTLDSVSPTKEITNLALVIKRPTTKQIHFPMREISTHYLLTELKWYWSGDNSVDTIGKAAKMWYRISDDGQTSNSAYGYIVHKKYETDQLQQVLHELKRDKTSRRAILNISDPRLNKSDTKDLQCTIAVQFLIRHNKLHMTVYMRSNDIYFGLPYDSIYFISIQEWLAQMLDIKVGTYTHHATSMHVYTKDIIKLKPHNQYINIDVQQIILSEYK